jgi:hypothetical protein
VIAFVRVDAARETHPLRSGAALPSTTVPRAVGVGEFARVDPTSGFVAVRVPERADFVVAEAPAVFGV